MCGLDRRKVGRCGLRKPGIAILRLMPTAAFVPRLLVRSSSIHAAGCYTLDPIPKGKRILEYDGPRISKALADERYAERPVTYLFGFEDRSDVIDGFGTAMFINHSCAPNCATESKDGRVFIRALRDIQPNEELLYEYNLYDSDEDDQTCYCGAPQCRGTMFSDWELKRQARARARREKAAKG
jgi:SET domain-containing protein